MVLKVLSVDQHQHYLGRANSQTPPYLTYKSEILGMGLSNAHFNKASRRF